MGILQLAHGEVYMIGAYVVYYLCSSLGLNVYFSILISMVVMAAFGIFLEGSYSGRGQTGTLFSLQSWFRRV